MDYVESNGNRKRIPQYILDVFDRWRFEKKTVVIYPDMSEKIWYDVPLKLINLFFHSYSAETYPSDTSPRMNLLTTRVLAIFPELEYVQIRMDSNQLFVLGDAELFNQYPFSLSLFINETLMGLQSAKNGNFQCDVYGKWVSSEYEKLSADFAPFVLLGMKRDEWGEYLRIQHQE